MVRKVEAVILPIRTLLSLAHQHRSNEFSQCSRRICASVQEMVNLFPPIAQNPNAAPPGSLPRALSVALSGLVTSARDLKRECDLGPNREFSEDVAGHEQQVIQFAHDIAQAAKQLLTLFQ